MLSKLVLFLVTSLTAYGAAAGTKIYTYLDDQGVRHYTDIPDSARYRLLVLSPNERTRSGDRYDAQLLARAGQYESLIESAAGAAAVEANLLRAVIVVESGFNPRAVSKKGALGLMQLMPATAQRFGASNALDPRQNIAAGAKYLRYLVDKYLDDPAIPEREKVLMTLAAYNAGPENLRHFRDKARQNGFDPNIWFGNVEHGAAAVVGQETVQYVGNIYKYYVVYSALLTKG